MRIFLLGFLILNSLLLAAQNRVVSLSPNITHTILELGGEKSIVGCTKYCIQTDNHNIPIVSDALNVNIERIVSLKPSLVLAGGLIHPNIVNSLKSMGIKVEHWNQPKSFEEICKQTIHIGSLIGLQVAADSIVSKSKTKVKKITQNTLNVNGFSIFFQIGTNPLYTILDDSFLADFVYKLNANNISKGLTNGQISSEFVLMNKPDVILISSMGGLGEEQVDFWKQFSFLPAVRNKKVFLIPEYDICSPTPLRFAQTLEKIYNLIYEK